MMAWRVWSKLCCGHRWLLLLSPILLLFLTISVMIATLPIPLPPSDIDWLPSRVLSSTNEGRVREPPPSATLQQPPSSLLLPNIHSGAWNSRYGKEPSKHLMMVAEQPKPGRNAGSKDINNFKEGSHTHSHKNKYRAKGTTFKRKGKPAARQQPTNHHSHLSQPAAKSIGPQHRIRQSNHSAVAAAVTNSHLTKSQPPPHIPSLADTQLRDRRHQGQLAERWTERQRNIQQKDSQHADSWEDSQANTQVDSKHMSSKLAEQKHALEKQRQAIKHSWKSDQVTKEQQAVEKPSRALKKHFFLSEEPSEKKRKNTGTLDYSKSLSSPKEAVNKDEASCQSQSLREQDFSNSDQRRIRMSLDSPPPWFSVDDIQKMELLAGGQVVSKARVPAHGQVLQVALDDPLTQQTLKKSIASKNHTTQHGLGHRDPGSHSEHCQQGSCSLIKRPDDWYEVFAFHLDRVLGLNRSLPAVLRNFNSDILPYKYISGVPRPVVWWDPDIQHLDDSDNDQNSVPLSWVLYQELLKVHCGKEADLNSVPCVGVHHSEWGRLALFDFLLQVNDRLDRYCCGFRPDSTDTCVENFLNIKCQNTKELVLVHILVRKADPSRLVFIDNAGRPHQPADNLNFKLVMGIDEFPEKAVSVLQSGCLESRLLDSLYTDREFWDSRGGADGLRPLIHAVEQRAKNLLQHMRDKKLQLNRDL